MIRGNFLLVYLFCGLVAASCTPTARPSQSTHVAAAATATETAAAAEPSDPSKELVCGYETITGTRFRRRYCTTQAERERRQQDDREAGEKLQRKGAQVSVPPT